MLLAELIVWCQSCCGGFAEKLRVCELQCLLVLVSCVLRVAAVGWLPPPLLSSDFHTRRNVLPKMSNFFRLLLRSLPVQAWPRNLVTGLRVNSGLSAGITNLLQLTWSSFCKAIPCAVCQRCQLHRRPVSLSQALWLSQRLRT